MTIDPFQPPQSLHLRVLLTPCGDYIEAHALEFDLVSGGATAPEALASLRELIAAQLGLCNWLTNLGAVDFPAPAEFDHRWNQANLRALHHPGSAPEPDSPIAAVFTMSADDIRQALDAPHAWQIIPASP